MKLRIPTNVKHSKRLRPIYCINQNAKLWIAPNTYCFHVYNYRHWFVESEHLTLHLNQALMETLNATSCDINTLFCLLWATPAVVIDLHTTMNVLRCYFVLQIILNVDLQYYTDVNEMLMDYFTSVAEG